MSGKLRSLLATPNQKGEVSEGIQASRREGCCTPVSSSNRDQRKLCVSSVAMPLKEESFLATSGRSQCQGHALREGVLVTQGVAFILYQSPDCRI